MNFVLVYLHTTCKTWATVILIIISIPSPRHTFIPGLKLSFSANPSHSSLSFYSSGLTTCIPQTYTATSKHTRFYFLVFLFYAFQLSFQCGRLSWLMSAFERMLKQHLVSYISYRITASLSLLQYIPRSTACRVLINHISKLWTKFTQTDRQIYPLQH